MEIPHYRYSKTFLHCTTSAQLEQFTRTIKMSNSGKQQQQQVSDVRSSSKLSSATSASRKDVDVKSKKSTNPFETETLAEDTVSPGANLSPKLSPSSAKVQADKADKKIAGVHTSPVTKFNQSPGQLKLDDRQKVNVAVPRLPVPLQPPPLNVRPFVLATHLVPSLPVSLFELLAEAIEAATQLPVSLLYESRNERPVAKDVVDMAILPAYGEWEDGDLFPVTFVFAHRLNDNESGNVYVEIVVAEDRAAYVKDLMDLRGHRCALPDRRKRRGAAALLLGDLRAKGEGPAFFGNTLDSGSQIAALQMVAGKQAEIGVVEAPVLEFNRRKMPGVSSLLNLASLGPLPPYAIYVKKNLSAEVRQKISSYLLNLKNDEDWTERFSQYGIIGFTTNSIDEYLIDEDAKEIATSVRYY